MFSHQCFWQSAQCLRSSRRLFAKNLAIHWLVRRKLRQSSNKQSQLSNLPICWMFKGHHWPMSRNRATCSITIRKECKISRMKCYLSNFVQTILDVESTRCLGTMNHRHPEDGFVENENSSCIGSDDQVPSRKTRSSDQNWFFIKRWISFVGYNFEPT